ncbi:unnamed protein product, partial [Coregonus sp. 'balchen']
PGYTHYDTPGHIHYNDTARDTDQVEVLDSSLFQYSSEVEKLLPSTDQHPTTGQVVCLSKIPSGSQIPCGTLKIMSGSLRFCLARQCSTWLSKVLIITVMMCVLQELVMEQSEKIETLPNVPTHTSITHTSITHTLPPEHTHTEEPPTWGRAQQEAEAERRRGSPPVDEEHTDDLTALGANGSAYLGSVGGNESAYLGHVGGEREDMTEPWALSRPAPLTSAQETLNTPHTTLEGDRMMERENTIGISMMERETTMRSLVDLQRKVEQKQQRDRERQLLRVQERLTIMQNKKSQEDLMGLRQTDRLRHLTHNLPQADKSQQKTVVRERLEQLRRERSYVMQSKRDRNTAGFKELLGPVGLHSAETDDTADSLRLATNAS